MSKPIIEDEFEDVLGKASRGLKLSTSDLAVRAGIPSQACQELLSGHFDDSAIRRIAPVLHLNTERLLELANKPKGPAVDLPDGIRLHNTPFPVPGYQEMTVNSYSLIPPGQSGEAAFIDAGATFESVTQTKGEAIGANWQLFLTHTHADHVVNYDALSGIVFKAFTPAGEPYSDALPVRDNERFEIGPWQLTAMETPGHSPNGMSYLLDGAGRPVAFVGDALFCYSVGKIAEGYENALARIRRRILTLPGETIICPGHGPLTTVEFERQHNPFFA